MQDHIALNFITNMCHLCLIIFLPVLTLRELSICEHEEYLTIPIYTQHNYTYSKHSQNLEFRYILIQLLGN